LESHGGLFAYGVGLTALPVIRKKKTHFGEFIIKKRKDKICITLVFTSVTGQCSSSYMFDCFGFYCLGNRGDGFMRLRKWQKVKSGSFLAMR
jgi:hypothetical protein